MSLIGGAAAVVIVDFVLLAFSTQDHWMLAQRPPTPADVLRWEQRSGQIAEPWTGGGLYTAPATVSGWRPGPAGAPGASWTSNTMRRGLYVFDVAPVGPAVAGEVVVGQSYHVWSIRTALPLGSALERWRSLTPPATPGHPVTSWWRVDLRPVQFVLNTVLFAAVLAIGWRVAARFNPLFRGRARERRGCCRWCGFQLLPSQPRCPECGRARRVVEPVNAGSEPASPDLPPSSPSPD